MEWLYEFTIKNSKPNQCLRIPTTQNENGSGNEGNGNGNRNEGSGNGNGNEGSGNEGSKPRINFKRIFALVTGR